MSRQLTRQEVHVQVTMQSNDFVGVFSVIAGHEVTASKHAPMRKNKSTPSNGWNCLDRVLRQHQGKSSVQVHKQLYSQITVHLIYTRPGMFRPTLEPSSRSSKSYNDFTKLKRYFCSV
jgi:hypothetical protein